MSAGVSGRSAAQCRTASERLSAAGTCSPGWDVLSVGPDSLGTDTGPVTAFESGTAGPAPDGRRAATRSPVAVVVRRVSPVDRTGCATGSGRSVKYFAPGAVNLLPGEYVALYAHEVDSSLLSP